MPHSNLAGVPKTSVATSIITEFSVCIDLERLDIQTG